MKISKQFVILFLLGILALVAGILLDGTVATCLLIGGIVLVVLSVILLLTSKEKKEEPINEGYEYAVKKSVMSAPEIYLYKRLLDLTGEEVLPQVALVTLVDKTAMASYRNELFRVVDFAVCDKKTFKPLFVVELNDASHNRDDRRLRDEKVKCILARAGLPLAVLTIDDIKLDDKSLRKKILAQIR